MYQVEISGKTAKCLASKQAGIRKYIKKIEKVLPLKRYKSLQRSMEKMLDAIEERVETCGNGDELIEIAEVNEQLLEVVGNKKFISIVKKNVKANEDELEELDKDAKRVLNDKQFKDWGVIVGEIHRLILFGDKEEPSLSQRPGFWKHYFAGYIDGLYKVEVDEQKADCIVAEGTDLEQILRKLNRVEGQKYRGQLKKLMGELYQAIYEAIAKCGTEDEASLVSETNQRLLEVLKTNLVEEIVKHNMEENKELIEQTYISGLRAKLQKNYYILGWCRGEIHRIAMLGNDEEPDPGMITTQGKKLLTGYIRGLYDVKISEETPACMTNNRKDILPLLMRIIVSESDKKFGEAREGLKILYILIELTIKTCTTEDQVSQIGGTNQQLISVLKRDDFFDVAKANIQQNREAIGEAGKIGEQAADSKDYDSFGQVRGRIHRLVLLGNEEMQFSHRFLQQKSNL